MFQDPKSESLLDYAPSENLVDLLESRVNTLGNKTAFHFQSNQKAAEEWSPFTYLNLTVKTKAVAAALQARRAFGERVLLIFQPGVEFVSAFWGCLYAGAIAVPIYPPRKKQHYERIGKIIQNADSKYILCQQEWIDQLNTQNEDELPFAKDALIAIESVSNDRAEDWKFPDITAQSLAFLQYTSGSTGTPKGVMVEHNHLLANFELIAECFQLNPGSTGACWLPPYHDMGLIGGILESIYVGGCTYLLNPVSFLQKPQQWLTLISEKKISTSGGPNFAYDLCLKTFKPENAHNLDLSSWKVAFTGAEPIRAETLDKFTRTFESYGFSSSAFLPCYGLAEATLLVSGKRSTPQPKVLNLNATAVSDNRIDILESKKTETQGPPHQVVSSGTLPKNVSVRIVNPDTREPCISDMVGEVWVQSPSVARGYWQRPQLSQSVFGAQIAGEPQTGKFLRTGDLGFYQDEQLYITGRLKEMMIIRGRNYYPQDIEYEVQSAHPALRKHHGAAFALEQNGQSFLYLVQEVERTWVKKIDRQDILKTIRHAIAEQFDLQLGGLLLIKPARLPKTTSGKVQRLKCREHYLQNKFQPIFEWSLQSPSTSNSEFDTIHSGKPTVSADQESIAKELEQWLLTTVSTHLNISVTEINIDEPLANYGLSSLVAARLAGDLEEYLGISLDPVLVYDYPSIHALSIAIANLNVNSQPISLPKASEPKPRRRKSDSEIAVVGMGCRFPGANTVDEFWQVLIEGQDCISEVPSDRWDIDEFYDFRPNITGKMNTRWGGFIDDVAGFDAAFFNISAREAQTMDPQQRLLLEVTWHALENAGFIPDQLRGSSTGVFIGICSNDYARLFQEGDLSGPYAGTSNAHSIAANRLSYLMNWHGPSVAVDTACSSSLVAIHQACQTLKLSECDLAIAGGVNLILNPDLTITFSQAGMMSPDGRCKTFDADANGYVRGEGCGVVVLKRLDDAIRDGDRIYSVIKGAAINQDGQSNGLTAPNSLAQEYVIRAALNSANVQPEAVSIIETHGTGTPLGDPIEVTALKNVYGLGRTEENPLTMGSVKSNIGHLEAAAGIAGFIKSSLSLYHRHQVPTLHFQTLNPLIDLSQHSLFIAQESKAFADTAQSQRLCGISSFGFGGTNAHVILGDWPQSQTPIPKSFTQPYQLLALSSKTEKALQAQVRQCLEYVTQTSEENIHQTSLQLNHYRSALKHRLAVVAATDRPLPDQLEAFIQGETAASIYQGTVSSQKTPKVCFAFSGQGAQYCRMGQDLYQSHPYFRDLMNSCAAILEQWFDFSILSLLYPEDGDGDPSLKLKETQYTQPLLFSLEYSLAQLWISLGIQPDILMGHSLGEYVAACIAGVFSLEDALKLVTHRGRLMQSLPGNGAMLATLGDEDTIKKTLESFADLDIAAFNGPNNLVISGVCSAIEECIQALEIKGVNTKPLHVSHGFHSVLMEPILDEFRSVTQQVKFHPPQFDILSNVTGGLISHELCSPEYWVQHIRQPVQFAKNATYLLEQENLCLLEVGPHPTLLAMTKRLAKTLQMVQPWVGLPSLHRDQPDWQVFLSAVAQLYTQGFSINWSALGKIGSVIDDLPTYPFQHQDYWLTQKQKGKANRQTFSLSEKLGAKVITPKNSELHRKSEVSLSHQTRQHQILDILRKEICNILLDDGRDVDIHASFIELGADSINLIELIQVLEKTFETKVSVKDIFAEHNSLDKLSGYLDSSLPDSWRSPESAELELYPPTNIDVKHQYSDIFHHVDDLQQHLSQGVPQTPLESVVSQQLAVLQNVMLQQLNMMQGQSNESAIAPPNKPFTGPPTPDLLSRSSIHEPERNGHSHTNPKSNGQSTNGYSFNGHSKHHQNGNGHNQIKRNNSSASSLSAAVLEVSPTPSAEQSPTECDDQPSQIPLSETQRQMWWAEHLHPEKNIYLIPIALELKGILNQKALEDSLNQIIDRHESLRTRFLYNSGSPIQEILPARAMSITVEQVPAEISLAFAQTYVSQLCAPKFNLEKEPLLRSKLIQLGEDHHVLILVFHHLAADAWSTGVLIKEILQLYPAFCRNQLLRLEPLTFSYSSFLKQKAIALKEADISREAYWRHILKDAPEALALPYDQARPNPNSGRGATYFYQFSPELSQRVKSQSQQRGVTPYMMLLSAYSALLYQYTGQTDIIIGSTFAGRQQPETHHLMGLCLQTLLLRVKLDPTQSLQELLLQIRERTLEAFAHPDIPFEALKDLQCEPGEWFQAMLILQSTPHHRLELPEIELTQLTVHGDSAKCPLSLWIDDQPQGFCAEWEYNRDCFSEALIQGMAEQFTSLLKVFCEVSEASLSQNLSASIKTEIPSLDSSSSLIPVHQRFEQIVNRMPEAIALESQNKTWTYQTLNKKANQIAHWLLKQGLQPGDLVAMSLPRHPMQIAVILGILKAGGAYLPMDPTYPQARLKLMFQDAQPALLVTDGAFPIQTEETCPVFDILQVGLTDHCDQNPELEIDLLKPIYVIYTSGSTGRPKGTVLLHQGVANFIEQAIATYGFHKSDRILQFASISFDAAVEEIFGALGSGACLVLRDEHCIKSSQDFSAFCTTHHITVLDLPTAFWHRWVQDSLQKTISIPNTIREVIIGGEQVLPNVVRGWQCIPQTQHIQLFNTYGPTEATVVATVFEINAQTVIAPDQDIPIGQPLDGVSTFVVNEQGLPVPQGAIGELYLGGAGIAQGYLNQPDKTAHQFVCHPHNTNIKLYRTGDRVKALPDGNLLYLGRQDDQVKIRGFRVELGEVENLLLSHPKVQHCAVISTQDEQGVNQVWAYLVPTTTPLNSRTLRQDLSALLPGYMMPARLTWIEKIPLSPNGKLDRKALLATPQPVSEVEDPLEISPLMAELQELWQRLLQQPVSIQDSFFTLGGHSLMAMQLHGEIQERYQVDIPLIEFLADPTIENLAKSIEQAQPQQRVFPPIPTVDATHPQPLSIAQQRIWMLNQLHSVGAAYHITIAQSIHGDLNFDVLKQSMQCLVQRHGVLRTTFDMHEGIPCQILHEERSISFEHLDASSLKSSLTETLHAFASQSFDFSTGPLWRVLLIQHTPKAFTLVLVVHHIIADAWSVGILIQDLMTLYPQLDRGETEELDSLPIQYIDFAQWQRNYLQGEIRAQQLQYWGQKLADAPTNLELPTDFSRPSQPSFSGKLLRLPLSPELSHAVKDFSQSHNVTLYTTMLSVFGLLMHRYSQQPEVMIGTPTANRQHPQTHRVMGLFLNTLVLRLPIDLQSSFKALMTQTSDITAEAFSHQDIPFEELLRELNIEPQGNRPPWFQVMFILQNAHDYQLQLPGLDFSPISVDMGVAKFDLTLSVEETAEGLIGEWEYNSALFKSQTIQRMAMQYEYLLSQLIEAPTTAIQDLTLIPEAEITQIHTLASNPKAPVLKWVPQQFEEIAAQQPEQVALELEEQRWSYQDLNQWANQIAHYLAQENIQSGDRVGVCLESSPEAIATFLGILKGGACYVPIDPNYPSDRIQFMLEDAALSLLIHSGHQRIAEHNVLPSEITLLDIHDPKIQQQPYNNFDESIQGQDAAYLIYTSGSTGRPKGTVLGHGGFANFVQQAIETYDFDTHDRILQFSSLSFDAAIEEIYGALCSGATLVLKPESMVENYATFSQACEKLKLTVLDLPTAFWHQLTQFWASESRIPEPLRLIIIGGERALPSIVSQWQDIKPSVRLINTYGPTEATVVATSFEIVPEHHFALEDDIPIGRPLGNVTPYILDKEQRLLPIGVPGELYLGGIGLALRYWGQPELTHRAFVPNPFNPNERLYRTGDRVRWMPDGNLLYLGRQDDQVKIRGFRVELGEVENILQGHPDIQQCAVISQSDSQGIKHLIAYFVTPSKVSLHDTHLREHLREVVPPYMIPTTFQQLEQLPLTPTGKVDRRSLPAVNLEALRDEDIYVAPRTPTESALCFIVAEVLKQEQIGIFDNFFSLGGHSLAAMQVMTRVQDFFGKEVSVRLLLENPTVAGMAAHIDQQSSQETKNIPSLAEGNHGPLSIAQERLWFLYQLEGQTATYNLPFAVEITGELDLNRLAQSFNYVIERHESLRTSFAQNETGGVQIIHPTVQFKIQLIDCQNLNADWESTLEEGISEEAQTPFVLGHAPLLRARLYQRSKSSQVLLITLHHIISDAWSIGVLLQEIVLNYHALAEGKTYKFSALPIQYLDYAVWQRQQLKAADYQQRLEGWAHEFKNAPPLLELPTDFRRPKTQSFRGNIVRRPIDQKLIAQTQNFAQTRQTTLFVPLLAAYVALLSRYSNQQDFVIGTPVAGRSQTELEGLIGFFINTLPLRFRDLAHKTVDEVITQVQEIVLTGFEHQDIPFSDLVQQLPLNRDLSHLPLCQVCFVLQNAPIPHFELPDLHFKALPTHSSHARFDLTLSILEVKGRYMAEWEYNCDLFTVTTIERIAEHYEILLESMLANLDRPIQHLSLMSDREQQLLLVERNQTHKELPIQCIHRWIESQVEATPDAIALEFETSKLTYRELNQQANQLAHTLMSLGLAPEQLVGIYLNRSLEMWISVLAVWKARGAYVPLDPSYPSERLSYITQTAELLYVIQQSEADQRDIFAKIPHQIVLSQIQEELQSNLNSNLVLDDKPNDLAYVIFTSGSTGQPKGVMVEHRGLGNLALTQAQTFDVVQTSRVLQHASFSFDASVSEFLMAICTGATLCIEPPMKEGRSSLVTLLKTAGITHFTSTPSLLQYLPSQELKDVSHLIVAGEDCSEHIAVEWSNRTGFFNAYGPTETTVCTTISNCTNSKRKPDIGCPIANTRVYILDESLQMVSDGGMGELCVASVGLARGYWKNPELTAEKFIENPHIPGERIYRTGDRVRYNADGNLEYLGRMDHQVKLRGFRIELAEVETSLARHPKVDRSVVRIIEQSSDPVAEKILVAYVKTTEEMTPDFNLALEHHLQEILPHYMIPSQFVAVPNFVLTPNGKVDLAALPLPDKLNRASVYVPPQNPIESELVELWSELLDIATLGIEDNFFHLGGHSLLAMQLITRVKHRFGVEIPLPPLFDRPTIGQLAELIFEAQLTQTDPELLAELLQEIEQH